MYGVSEIMANNVNFCSKLPASRSSTISPNAKTQTKISVTINIVWYIGQYFQIEIDGHNFKHTNIVLPSQT